jgi:hypothetical protein
MANYNKSFNFRNGVQVDEDNFLVNSTGLVGIGTTIPRSELDVYGDIKATGVVTTSSLYVAGIATFTDVRIGTGITIYGNTGIISATFYGDGSNLRGVPTSQWVDVDAGLGYTSIYAAGNVGIATTAPTASLQVGGRSEIGQNGVGISSGGNINASGIITASSFVGSGANLTAINASNISSGTLSAERLPTEINISGVATVASLNSVQIQNTGIATFAQLNASQISVSGISTLGVATISTLYAGLGTITTFNASQAQIGVGTVTTLAATNASIAQLNATQINVSGISTLGVATISTLYAGLGTITTFNASQAQIGVGTITTLGATNVNITSVNAGVITASFINSSLSVLGVATATNLTSGNVRLSVSGTNELDTSSGNLTIDSAGGQVEIDDDLSVVGVSTFASVINANVGLLPDVDLGAYLGSGSKYFSGLYVGEVNIGVGASNQINTRSNNLSLDSATGQTVVNDNLNVTGYFGVTGVTTLSSSLNVAGQTTLSGLLDANAGAEIDNIRIGISGDNEIDTSTGTLTLDSTAGLITLDDNVTVSGYSYFTGIATVQTGLLPNSDKGAALGSSSLRFSDLYVDNIRVGVGSDNEITTGSGNLKLDSSSKLVEVADRFTVSGETFLTGIATASVGILPNTDKGAYIGTSGKAFTEAYINELTFGVSGTNTISTRSGNLVLDSQNNSVVINNDLTVSQITNLNNDVYIGTLDFYVDSLNNRIGIGTTSLSNDVTVLRDGNLNVELVSTTGTTQLSLGQSLGVGNNASTISYSGDLEIANKSSTGSINVKLSSGSGINTSSFFKVIHKGDTLISVGHSGVTGINKSNPNHALDVNGNLAVSGYGEVVGVLTVGQGANKSTLGLPNSFIAANLSGNVNAISGFSTFKNVNVDSVVTIGSTLSVRNGIGSFGTGVAIGNTNTLSVAQVNISPILNVDGDIHSSGRMILSGNTSKVGIATTSILTDDRPSLAAEDSNFPTINYGTLQIKGDFSVTGYSGGSSIFVPGPVGNTTAFLQYLDTRSLDDQNYQYSVGINTHVPRSCLDLGASASPLILPGLDQTRKQYMLDNPNGATITTYGASSGNPAVPGSLLFRTDINRAELGIGNTGVFCGIATLTYNGTGFDAFVPPKMTTTNRNALTGGGIADGAIIYNTSTNKLQLRASGAWIDLN